MLSSHSLDVLDLIRGACCINIKQARSKFSLSYSFFSIHQINSEIGYTLVFIDSDWRQ